MAQAADAGANATVADPDSFRLQLLDADVPRASRYRERAMARLNCQAADIASTGTMPWIHQLLEEVHLSAGSYPAAVRRFSTAMVQRVVFGQDAAVIYASTVAAHRALDSAERSAA